MKYLADVTTLAYAADKCAGCGRCVEVCPQGVFEMREDDSTLTPTRYRDSPHPFPSPLEGEGQRERGLYPREGIRKRGVLRAAITDRDLCMECGACARNCDFGAISVNAGVGCAAAIINSMITGGEPTCGCSDSGGSVSCC
jgi:ferredoxin